MLLCGILSLCIYMIPSQKPMYDSPMPPYSVTTTSVGFFARPWPARWTTSSAAAHALVREKMLGSVAGKGGLASCFMWYTSSDSLAPIMPQHILCRRLYTANSSKNVDAPSRPTTVRKSELLGG